MEPKRFGGDSINKDNVIKSYAQSKKRRKAVTTGLISTGLIILLIAALSYYGINVGSFVVKLHNTNDAQALALTIDDLSKAESYESVTTTTRLAADPLKSCTDAELTDILNNQNKIMEGTGVRNEFNKSGNEIYFGYSFYLMNAGTESIDYNMDMHLLAVTRDLDEVLRVMVVYDDDYTNYEVYAKAQPDGTPESKLVGEGYHGGNLVNLGETIPFLNGEDDVIINKHFKDFNSGSFTKFTVLMWLDGWDAQETDDMLGGGIKLSLDFYIADEK